MNLRSNKGPDAFHATGEGGGFGLEQLGISDTPGGDGQGKSKSMPPLKQQTMLEMAKKKAGGKQAPASQKGSTANTNVEKKMFPGKKNMAMKSKSVKKVKPGGGSTEELKEGGLVKEKGDKIKSFFSQKVGKSVLDGKVSPKAQKRTSSSQGSKHAGPATIPKKPKQKPVHQTSDKKKDENPSQKPAGGGTTELSQEPKPEKVEPEIGEA